MTRRCTVSSAVSPVGPDLVGSSSASGVCDESELRCECLAVIYAALFLLIWSGVIAAVMVVG